MGQLMDTVEKLEYNGTVGTAQLLGHGHGKPQLGQLTASFSS
jgi:hypothetical protein